MADTPAGETVTPEAPSNGPSAIAAPVTDNSNVDVEAAKKEAEQAQMRANQLENELKKIKDAQEAARQKQLEEEGRWKELAEKSQAELNRIQEEQAQKERTQQLQTATQDVLKDYPANVVEVAKTTGLSLLDDSEEAKIELKAKLDVIKAQVAPSTTASASNPYQPAPANADKSELVARMRGDNVDVSRKAIQEYVHNHPAVQRMREIAQNGA